MTATPERPGPASAGRERFTLDLDRIDDLFHATARSPLDEGYGAHGASAALVYVAEVLAASSGNDPVELHLRLPVVDSGEAAEIQAVEIEAGVRRWAGAELATRRRVLAADRRFGSRALVAGVVLLVVLITGSRWLELRDDEFSAQWILSQGLMIGAWVSLWTPLDHIIFGFWRQRSDTRAYERLSGATVSLARR